MFFNCVHSLAFIPLWGWRHIKKCVFINIALLLLVLHATAYFQKIFFNLFRSQDILFGISLIKVA